MWKHTQTGRLQSTCVHRAVVPVLSFHAKWTGGLYLCLVYHSQLDRLFRSGLFFISEKQLNIFWLHLTSRGTVLAQKGNNQSCPATSGQAYAWPFHYSAEQIYTSHVTIVTSTHLIRNLILQFDWICLEIVPLISDSYMKHWVLLKLCVVLLIQHNYHHCFQHYLPPIYRLLKLEFHLS